MLCSTTVYCVLSPFHNWKKRPGQCLLQYIIVLQYWRTKTTKTSILLLTFLHNYIFYANKYNKSPVVWCTLQRTYFMAIKSIEKVSFTSHCYCTSCCTTSEGLTNPLIIPSTTINYIMPIRKSRKYEFFSPLSSM